MTIHAVPDLAEPTNLTEQRNADEARGRAERQLETAATTAGFVAHYHHYGCTYDYSDDRTPYWVTLSKWPEGLPTITEHAATLVEALDRARDRLSRQEWDR